MRTHERHTNQTYTKRVDHDAGQHHTPRALPEPAVCEVCGDVYADRRWSQPDAAGQGGKHPHFRPPHVVVCPACRRQREGVPGGFVHLAGTFLAAHRAEVERLLENEAGRAAEDNPLSRLMGLEEAEGGVLTVTTTTEHLAQRLGHALEKAYAGDVRYDFSHENKLARVYWQRD
jgi:hypothetical protein